MKASEVKPGLRVGFLEVLELFQERGKPKVRCLCHGALEGEAGECGRRVIRSPNSVAVGNESKCNVCAKAARRKSQAKINVRGRR